MLLDADTQVHRVGHNASRAGVWNFSGLIEYGPRTTDPSIQNALSRGVFVSRQTLSIKQAASQPAQALTAYPGVI